LSEEFIKEVDEALARDRMASVWRRSRPFVYGGIAALILGVAGFEAWRWNQSRAVERDAVAFHAAAKALEEGKPAEAAPALKELAEGKGGFAAIAPHVLAEAERASGGDVAAALAQGFDETNVFGDLARLKAAYAQADTVELAALEELVAPLIEEGGAAGALARELIAAKALATGDVERARRDYQALSIDIDAPQQLQARAGQALLTLPAAAAPAAAVPAAPATQETP
jgi:hypothetical protein